MWRHKRLQGIFCDRGSGGVEGESGATDADEATGLPRDGPPTQLRGTAVGMWDEAVEGEGEKACYYGQGNVTAALRRLRGSVRVDDRE